MKRECRKFKKEQLKEKGKEHKEEKDIAAVALDGDVVLAFDETYANITCDESTWVVDTATSFISLHIKISSLPTLVAILVGLG
jgi:aspartate/methionine/tyrosine aminotransferase